jgi:cobalamin biosynthesis protein CobD/CbiB
MAFFSLIAALALNAARPLPERNVLLTWFHRYADQLAHDLNAGRPRHGTVGWLAAVCPWVLVAVLLFYFFYTVNPALGWLWTVAVLYACVGLRQVTQALKTVFEALHAGDLERARHILFEWRGEPAYAYSETEIVKATIETALLRAHRDVFGVVFWFILLPGPAGALLYRLAAELDQRWGRRQDEEFAAFGRFAARAFQVLDWLPARLSAVGFAIAGNFEDAVSTWRTDAPAWGDPAQGIVLASGAGALGVRLGGPLPREAGVEFRPDLGEGEVADAQYLQSALYLLWRTLIVWMVLLLLLTLGAWVGG